MCFKCPHTVQISLKLCLVSSDLYKCIHIWIRRAKNKWVFLQSPSLKCKIGLWSVESAFVDQMTRVHSSTWVVSFLFNFFNFETYSQIWNCSSCAIHTHIATNPHTNSYQSKCARKHPSQLPLGGGRHLLLLVVVVLYLPCFLYVWRAGKSLWWIKAERSIIPCII